MIGHLAALPAAIQTGDAESIRRPTRAGETDRFHSAEHLFRRRKFMDRSRKIFVRTFYPGDQRADTRQNVSKIKTIEFAQQAAWFAEIQDAGFSFRLQHTEDFAQS